MIRDRKQAMEIVFAVIGGVYLLYRIFGNYAHTSNGISGTQDQPASVEPGTELSSLKTAVGKLTEPEKRAEQEYMGGRDPFESPDAFKAADDQADGTGSDTGPDSVVLEGTVCGKGKSVAIISGAVAEEGDIVHGLKVSRIEIDRVIVIKNGLETEIKRSR